MTSEALAQILALITSVFYAGALVSARAGMRHSTPTTVTLVSILMQNLLLWSAVFLTGGVHAVPLTGILLFSLVGIFQLGVRLLAYTGVEKIGASRSSALQSISPLISASIAIIILGEHASALILPWHRSRGRRDRLGVMAAGRAYRGFPPLASAVADRRGFSYRNESSDSPLCADPGRRAAIFFRAHGDGFARSVSWSIWRHRHEPSVWCGTAGAVRPFLTTGLCETLSILCIITAISLGRVVMSRRSRRVIRYGQ